MLVTHNMRNKPRQWRLGRLGSSIVGQGAVAQNTGESILNAAGIVGTGGAGGAVKGAAAGASVGSAIFPGLGTAIGAAVGAIVGGLVHFGTGAQRLATATTIINELKAQPPPLNAGRLQTLQVIEECFGALVSTGNLYGYVRPSPADSPSDIHNEFTGYMDMIKQALQQMNATPVGQTVNFSYSGWNGVHFTASFRNPGSSDTNAVLQTVIMPLVSAWCTHMGAVDVNNCAGDFNKPIVQLVYGLMTDYQIGQYPPPASQNMAPTPPAIVTPAKQATVTVTTPQATTTQTAGKPVTVSNATGAPLTANTQPIPPAASVQTLPYDTGPGTGVMTSSPSGATVQTISSPSVQTPQVVYVPQSDGSSAQPITVNVPATAAPVAASGIDGIPSWAILAGLGLAALILMRRPA